MACMSSNILKLLFRLLLVTLFFCFVLFQKLLLFNALTLLPRSDIKVCAKHNCRITGQIERRSNSIKILCSKKLGPRKQRAFSRNQYGSISEAMKKNGISSWRLIGVKGQKRFFISNTFSLIVVIKVGKLIEVVIYDVFGLSGCSKTWILNRKQLNYDLTIIEEYFYNKITGQIERRSNSPDLRCRYRVMFFRKKKR
jgi:hypothetical protein